MTSRQRLLNVLAGKPVDRIPVSTYELSGYNSKAFENNDPSYKPLMDLIRQYSDCIAMWEPSSTEKLAHSAFDIGIVEDQTHTQKGLVSKLICNAQGTTLSSTRIAPDDINTVWVTEHWCKDLDDVDAYMSIPFEQVTYDFSDYTRIKTEVSDNGIIMSSVGDAVCTTMEMMEFGEATVWALTEEEHYAKTVKQIHERIMKNLEQRLKTQSVDLYRIYGPEYMTPPYMSPEMFQKYVCPCVAEMTDLIHQYGSYARLHAHGKVLQVLDMIKKTGVDAIDPCEDIPDGDVSFSNAIKILGKNITPFGNIQLKLLENGTQEEVRQGVIKLIQENKESRFVIMPTASPINTPVSIKTVQNYKVFLETAFEYGKL